LMLKLSKPGEVVCTYIIKTLEALVDLHNVLR